MKQIFQNKKRLLLFISLMLILVLILLPNISHAQQGDQTLAQTLNENFIRTSWRFVLSLLNGVVVLGLIFIALANILRINIETYHIKRMLPSIILGVILANFSFLICRVMVDFAQVVADFFIGDVHGTDIINIIGFGTLNPNGGVVGVGTFLSAYLASAALPIIGLGPLLILLLVIIIIVLPILLLIITLAFIIAVRTYLIWFLVIVSPIAFFCLMFVPLNKIWQMWWSNFIKWLFLAPISFFFLRIAAEISRAAGGSSVLTGGFARWFFGIIMFALAIYMPFMLGGKIVSGWAGLMKGIAGYGLKGANQARIGAGGWVRARGDKSNKSWMTNLGKGLMSDPLLLLQTRMEQRQKDIETASYGGPLAFIGGKRTTTKMRINAAGQFQDSDLLTARSMADDEQVKSYLKKLDIDPKYGPRTDKEANAEKYLSLLKDATGRGERNAAFTLKGFYDDALGKHAFTPGKNKDIQELISRAGIHVESVPGEGTPQISSTPGGPEEGESEPKSGGPRPGGGEGPAGEGGPGGEEPAGIEPTTPQLTTAGGQVPAVREQPPSAGVPTPPPANLPPNLSTDARAIVEALQTVIERMKSQPSLAQGAQSPRRLTVELFNKPLSDSEIKSIARMPEINENGRRVKEEIIKNASYAKSEALRRGDKVSAQNVDHFLDEHFKNQANLAAPYITTLKEQVIAEPASVDKIQGALTSLKTAKPGDKKVASEAFNVYKQYTPRARVEIGHLENDPKALEHELSSLHGLTSSIKGSIGTNSIATNEEIMQNYEIDLRQQHHFGQISSDLAEVAEKTGDSQKFTSALSSPEIKVRFESNINDYLSANPKLKGSAKLNDSVKKATEGLVDSAKRMNVSEIKVENPQIEKVIRKHLDEAREQISTSAKTETPLASTPAAPAEKPAVPTPAQAARVSKAGSSNPHVAAGPAVASTPAAASKANIPEVAEPNRTAIPKSVLEELEKTTRIGGGVNETENIKGIPKK